MANVFSSQGSGPSFGHRGHIHLPFRKHKDTKRQTRPAASTSQEYSLYPLSLVPHLRRPQLNYAPPAARYTQAEPVEKPRPMKSMSLSGLEDLLDSTSMTSSQFDELLQSMSVGSRSYSGIASASSSAAPSTESKPRSNTLSWPTRKSKSGVALPFGQQPTKYKTDTEIMNARLLQSKNIRITGNAAALFTLKEKTGYRCVAFRLNQNAANPKKWIWHEILDAPMLSFESTKGMNTDTETHAFRTQVLHSRERTDVSSNPDYGQFDICFQNILRIDGAFLQYEGQELSDNKYRSIDKLALLEVRNYNARRGSASSPKRATVAESTHGTKKSRRSSLAPSSK